MVKSVPLHVAKSMASLRSQIHAGLRSDKPLTIKRLQKLYHRTVREAQQYLEVQGDRELAYLAYSRALQYVNLITQCKEYEDQSVKSTTGIE